jgi:hypothetical protein
MPPARPDLIPRVNKSFLFFAHLPKGDDLLYNGIVGKKSGASRFSLRRALEFGKLLAPLSQGRPRRSCSPKGEFNMINEHSQYETQNSSANNQPLSNRQGTGKPAKARARTADKSVRNSGNSGGARKPDGTFLIGNPYAFKPGRSGNPAGRPPGTKPLLISKAMRDLMKQPFPDAPERNYAEMIGELLVGAALGGNIKAISELLDRTEGRPKQTVHNVSNFDSERWLYIASVLVSALEPYPDAKGAVLTALDGIKSQDEQDNANS